MTQEIHQDANEIDPFKELRDGLEVMNKKQLVKARADAVKGVAHAVLTHPAAQAAEPKSKSMANYGSIPPKELTVPNMGVSIKAETLDMGHFVGSEFSMLTITSVTQGDAPDEAPREFGTSDKPLGDDFSLRDMQAVIDDIVALRTMQEQLTVVE